MFRSKKNPLKKILIIRLSSIGDIVLTTPVIRCLKNQLKDVSLHFLVKSRFLPVLEANPYIDKIHVFNESDGLRKLIPELKMENFDHVIDLHKNFRSVYLKKKLGKPSSGFPKINTKKWLMVNFKINKLPNLHVVDRYFYALKPFNIENDGKGLDYFIPDKEQHEHIKLPGSHQKECIGWVLGARHNTKIFPVEKIIPVIKKINKPFILLGGIEDKERGEQIKEAAGDKVVNACGKCSINQSAYIVKNADRIITNDTGLMHIAAAFGKRILSVWGNTIPEFGMYPYFPYGSGNKSIIAEVKNLSCRPCSKLGFKKCPKKHFKCMMDIDEEEIIEFANG